MSRIGQDSGYVNREVARLEALPQPVVAYRRDLDAGEAIPFHRHRRAQLVYARRGVMTVTTSRGAFVAPPQRAVWVPGGVAHRIDAHGRVEMRTVYIETDAAPGLPADVCVLGVTPLLRELILAAAEGTRACAPGSPESRLMGVILDQIGRLPVAPLALSVPADPRLHRITTSLIADPADERPLAVWAREAGASERTLARRFRAETGMSFTAWRQQLRLLRAVELLATGASVTRVALDLGYGSPSAFTAMFRRALGASPTRYMAGAGPAPRRLDAPRG